VGEPGHDRRHEAGVELVAEGPMMFSVMRVSASGAMALALMLYFAPSTARTRVKPTRPIFAAP
jgi:hypothetical protein